MVSSQHFAEDGQKDGKSETKFNLLGEYLLQRIPNSTYSS